MSGHSTWNNIKRTKEKSDAQKGKIFTKIGREIAVAVKDGGADPTTNNRLKDVIAKARQNNMPNDSIQRAIKKASGDLAGVTFENIVYEGYGAGGAAVIVDCLTDNKNRTAGDVRHAFDKFGGSLGANGCVSYLFKRKGIIFIEKNGQDADELMMAALEAGARDIIEDENSFIIETAPEEIHSVQENLEKAGYTIDQSDVELVPDMYVELEENKAGSFERMVEMLEDLDDVQNVYHNVK